MNNSPDHVVRLVTYLGQEIKVMIDRADENLFDRHKWHGSSNGGKSGIFYISTSVYDPATGQVRRLYLHRYLMNPPARMLVDHVNRDTTDNRRSNLRVVTRSQNIANSRGRRTYRDRPVSSSYKGVSWSKQRRSWVAKICHEGKSIGLGYFEDEVEAARAYDAKAGELNGEYAYLNFPEDWLSSQTSLSEKGVKAA